VVPGVGLELPFQGDMLKRRRCRKIGDVKFRLSVASLPFSFLGNLLRRGLVEGEMNESERSKMSKMWEYRQLPRRNALGYLWKNSALPLPKVLVSFFRKTMIQPFFFFSVIVRRLFD
jgi:hypothetical protein